MSYARLRLPTIATTAAALLQKVPIYSNGENAATSPARNSPEPFFEEPEHIRRRDRAQRPDHIVNEIGERKEARERQNEQHRGKQGKKEVIRELGREARAIVIAYFLDPALQEVAPAQGDVDAVNMSARRVQPHCHRARRDLPWRCVRQ